MTALPLPTLLDFGPRSGDHEVRGDCPLVLQPGHVWLVTGGRIDVFARAEHGHDRGARTHLFRVGPGRALIGSREHAGMHMLGVGAPGTTVREVEPRTLDPAACRQLLEGWARDVYQVVTVDVRAPRHQILEPGAITDLPAGTAARPAVPLVWLEFSAGEGCLLDRPMVPIQPATLLPLSDGAWIQAMTAARVRVRSTEELVTGSPGDEDEPGLWAGVAHLNRLVLMLIAERQSDAVRAHRERAMRRSRASESLMSSALESLATTVTGNPDRPFLHLRPAPDGQREANALVSAFRLVAATSGIHLGEMAKREERIALKDPVAAVARSARVRTRRVALRERWWEQDGAPLLAVLAERPHPVALLPQRGGYVLVDPLDQTQTRVDETVAGTLARFAYTLYRPFDAGPLRAFDLVRFGLHGTRPDIIVIAAMGALVAVTGLVPPLALGAVYNTIIPGAQRDQLLQLVLALVVCALAVTAFEAVRGFALLRLEAKTGPAVQAAVWDRLLKLPLPFFKNYTAGDLAVRAMSIEEMRSIASGTVVTLVLSGVLSLANFVLLFSYDIRLAWLGVGLIAIAVAVSWILSYLQIRRQRLILPLRSRISGVVHQLLAGIAKLKAAGAEVHGFSMWARLFSEQRRLQFRATSLRNAQVVFSATFPLLASVLLFHAVLGVRSPESSLGGSPLDTVMPTGDFLAFLAAFNIALSGMLTSASALVGALSVVPLYEQLKPILSASPEVHTGKRDPGELSGAIELQRVTFRYAPNVPPALNDLSILVRAGEFVALVGPSGSGKSTVLRLLLGFEQPETGSVSYDEQDLRGLDPEVVRRQIGVVTQTGRLMPGDIFTNIVGSSAVGIDAAWEAARMAGLDEDIRQMPMGMHTVISDGGGTFSGGQRQRLMIARALLHRPRILLFDEATSALDNRTQDVVSRNLERLKVTRIVVAHRLSTIRSADRIYVIKAGSLLEAGTFDELFACNGLFTELARSQLL